MAQMTILDDVFYGKVKKNIKILPFQLFHDKIQNNHSLESVHYNMKNELLNNQKKLYKQFKPYYNERDKLGKLITFQKYQQTSQKLQKQRSTHMGSQLTSFKQSLIFLQSANISKLQTKFYGSFKLNDIDHFPQRKLNQNHKIDLLNYKNDVIQMYKDKNKKAVDYITQSPVQKNPQAEGKILNKNIKAQKLHFRSKSVQNLSKSKQMTQKLISRNQNNFKSGISKSGIIKIIDNKKPERQAANIKINMNINHQELARYKQIKKLSLKICENLAQSQEKYNQNMRAIQRIKENSIRQMIKN